MSAMDWLAIIERSKKQNKGKKKKRQKTDGVIVLT